MGGLVWSDLVAIDGLAELSRRKLSSGSHVDWLVDLQTTEKAGSVHRNVLVRKIIQLIILSIKKTNNYLVEW